MEHELESPLELVLLELPLELAPLEDPELILPWSCPSASAYGLTHRATSLKLSIHTHCGPFLLHCRLFKPLHCEVVVGDDHVLDGPRFCSVVGTVGGVGAGGFAGVAKD